MKELIRKILREQMENTVLVVFGGINYATPEWMESQMPPDMINDNTIIKSFNTNIDKVIDELNKLEYNNLQVVGFSAGARNVFKLAKKKPINFLGLIDPSVPESVVKFDKKTDEAIVDIEGLPANSILFFNNDNWDGFPEIKKRQPVLAKAMIEKGMKVVKTELKHEDIPEEFFTEYMNK